MADKDINAKIVINYSFGKMKESPLINKKSGLKNG